LYDTRAEAESAKQRLSSAIDVERVRIIDQGNAGSGTSGGNGLGNLYITDDDRHAYGEGLRRGGFLLCAEVHSGEDADEIVRLLEESASVDLDERSESWRSEGWTASAATGSGMDRSSGMGTNTQAQGTGTTSGRVVEEQRIPVVEEELRVGKREVTRGGARVRSYIREVPVHEQVTLREEHVQVERRPVDQTIASDASAGDLLQERNIEMREVAEEAVVQKVAQVREEVVVSKTAEERVEQIDDTVRRTEVDVQEGAQSTQRSAFGGFGNEQSPTTEARGPQAERIDERK
jgi:uncharacterized protein (TIGR02271 family)